MTEREAPTEQKQMPDSPRNDIPGGLRVQVKRRVAADRQLREKLNRPKGTRDAGAGGSSSTLMRLYTDEAPGLKADPFVILLLSIGFVFSVFGLHIIAKIMRKFLG